MRILFNQGTPVPLRDHLSDHQVDTVFEQEWSRLENGDLLETAEQAGYDVLVTTDQNLAEPHETNAYDSRPPVNLMAAHLCGASLTLVPSGMAR